ncbi:uncharacterized protein LOC120299742 [Crotalus tigris]|uniref:uncharacterized protein LOC120299742 n=1 Tax=Crotalus tigris TaxID=88082 RepID=UPI00192F1BED|nr:uncharacterized protein LOC120299742 [Crotalus tigris]
MGAPGQEEGWSWGSPVAPPTPILMLQCDNGPVGPRKLQTMVSLATGSLATSLSSTSPGKTMPLCRLSLLFLAWLSASRAQLKRQRVGELEPALGSMQESACSFGGGTRGDGGPTQEPFVLLPWALLLALSGSSVIYLLFAKEHGEGALAVRDRFWPLAQISSWLKDRSLLSLFGDTPEVEDAGRDADAQLEETLLRDVSGVLHIIRLRLWKIVRDRRKHQQLLHETH